MEVLRARLLDRMISEQEAARSRDRRAMVGTGDRSAKIRTYNFPQSRVTDHRINLSVHNLADVIDGRLDESGGCAPDGEPAGAGCESDVAPSRRALLAEATAALGRCRRARSRGARRCGCGPSSAAVSPRRRLARRRGRKRSPRPASVASRSRAPASRGRAAGARRGPDRLPDAAAPERPPGAHSPARDRRAGGPAARPGPHRPGRRHRDRQRLPGAEPRRGGRLRAGVGGGLFGRGAGAGARRTAPTPAARVDLVRGDLCRPFRPNRSTRSCPIPPILRTGNTRHSIRR